MPEAERGGHSPLQAEPAPTRETQTIIKESRRAVYAVVAKAIELRRQGKRHMEVCEALNCLGYRTRTGKPWQHPKQIIKLLRSFSNQG